MDIKELKDSILTEVKALRDEYEKRLKEVDGKSEKVSAEFKGFEEKINKAIDEKMAKLDELTRRADELEKRMGRLPFGGRGGEMDEEEKKKAEFNRKAFNHYLRKGITELGPEEKKALAESPDTAGGYLVIDQYLNEVILKAINVTPMRGLARVIPVTSKALKAPVTTIRPTCGWTNENVLIPESEPKYGQVEVPVESLKALVKVPNELLDDAAINIDEHIAQLLGDAFALGEDTAFAVGDGNGKPLGLLKQKEILANPVLSGKATTFTGDSFVDLVYAPNPRYTRNASFMMKRGTEAQLRKLKGGDGQYLWQPSLQAGKPNMLLGYPIYNQEDMDDVAPGKFPVVFGDFTYYWIADRKDISIQRLDQLFAGSGQMGFLGTKRVGGQPALAEAFRVMKIAAE